MSVYLNWVNPNAGSTTSIYRSSTPIDQANPGTPITTFADATNFYIDPVPKFGDTVYYLISAKIGALEVFSKQMTVVVTVDTGPGPQTLKWGDMSWGYFGRVSELDLGVSMSLWGTPPADRNWYKIIRRGRILYVCMPLFNSSKNANALIAAKVFNTGMTSAYDTGPGTAGEVIVNRGRRFAPRIAKFFDDANEDLAVTNYTTFLDKGMPMGRSEFVDILRLFWAEPGITSTSRTRMGAPFRFGQTAFPSATAYPFICSDFGSAAKNSVMGFGVIAPDVLGMGAAPQVMTSASNSCAPIVEYLGAVT